MSPLEWISSLATWPFREPFLYKRLRKIEKHMKGIEKLVEKQYESQQREIDHLDSRICEFDVDGRETEKWR